MAVTHLCRLRLQLSFSEELILQTHFSCFHFLLLCLGPRLGGNAGCSRARGVKLGAETCSFRVSQRAWKVSQTANVAGFQHPLLASDATAGSESFGDEEWE